MWYTIFKTLGYCFLKEVVYSKTVVKDRIMKIIIFGCGKIGTTVIASLLAEGHDIVAVDADRNVVTEVTNIYDVIGICGNGADYDTLAEAEVENCDMFIAVTGSDELNMLACYIARRMGAKNTVARIRNPEYNDQSLVPMKNYLGLTSALNPEQLIAHEIYNVLRFPNATKVETFTNRRLEMIELNLKEESPLIGISMIELRKKYPAKFLICAVLRDGEVYIPDGRFELRLGDRILLTAAPNELHKLLKNLGILKRQSRNVMILGASRISFYLSKMLLGSGISVKLIERNREKCEEFASVLPGAVIINGDGSREELLIEEGIQNMDAFVTLTDNDEENILNSFFVSKLGVQKTVTRVDRNELYSTVEKLGLDCMVSTHKSVSGLVLRYVRAIENSMGSNVERLYKVMDNKAEALEFNVLPEFEYCHIQLKDLNPKFKPNILITGILRDRKPIIPAGDDVILPGDRVVVLAKGHQLNDLSDIIR